LSKYIQYLEDYIHIKISFRILGNYKEITYNCVALGGTFDHIHLGHQVLLLTAVLAAEEWLRIGITS